MDADELVAERPRTRDNRDEEAAGRMARILQLPQSEVAGAIDRAVRGYSPSCLNLEEIDGLDSLSKDRLEHVEQCGFCRELKAAILRPTPAKAAEFSELAVNEYCASCGSRRDIKSVLGSLGFTPKLVDGVKKHFENVNVDKYIESARNSAKQAGRYARQHPVQVTASAAGIATLALGTALLVRAFRSSRTSAPGLT